VFSDEEILLRIERALMLNSLTREDAIAVSVRDGAVTLEGESGSWLSRLFAENAAESGVGVETVNNEIVIADDDVSSSAQLGKSAGVWWMPGGSAMVPALATTVAGSQHP
jgi:osmotically-inducible protein OsmY